MKILSVTIKNYRVHGDLTVDFDQARTVIGGPNEAGKSTLVEAVHNALFLRSRVTGAAHKAMLSEVHAGHPTVELRFESGGREYTITKVFSGNQSASTTLKEQPIKRDGDDAKGGKAGRAGAGGVGRTLRDDEAEARIHEILQAEEVGGGRSLENRLRMQWSHLWIWQGSSTDDPLAHANAERHARLLRDRLSQVEGGGVLESPLDAAAARDVADRQVATFTDKGKPRAGSGLDAAAKAFEAAKAARGYATAAVETLDEAVDTIEAAGRTIAACDAKIAEAREEFEEVRGRQREAAELGVQVAEEQAASAAAEAAHAEAVRTDAEIVACRAEIAALETRIDPSLKILAELEREEGDWQARCTAAAKQMMEAGQRQAAAAAAFALQDALEKHERLLVERAGLSGRCELIAEQRNEASRLVAERDGLGQVTAADLAALVRLDRARELAEATLELIATKVEVLAASEPLTLAGSDLEIGQPVTITGVAELAVGGGAVTARVRISPGGGRTLAEATEKRDEASAALEMALAASGFETIDAAREAHAHRQVLDADIHAVNLAINGLGGDAADAQLEALDAEIVKAAAEARRRSADGLVRPASLAAAEAARAEGERELTAAGEAVATATAAVATARARLDAVARRRSEATESLRVNRTEFETLRTKAAVLEERHGTDRAQRVATLAEARERAATQLAASRARLARLHPDALELDRQRLERTITNLTGSKQDAETKRQLARAKLELEGTADPRDDLSRAAAKLRLAAAEHERAVREAEAVKLLAELFGEKKREVESQFVAPLTRRVTDYLERLYGAGTTVGVDYENGRFSRLTLSRRGAGNATFEFSQLSSGAKEQAAAAFRLAMAEVLAEDHDGSLPVIFDDAFVNSDARRQRVLQRLLDLAATRGLQVVVLSCRPENYATLGGVNITLPDNPFAAPDSPAAT
jgi:DNA repair exonuclease SbcCD ATPase subunit